MPWRVHERIRPLTAFGSLPLTAFASQRDCVRSWHSVSDSGYWILSFGIVLERAAQLALGMAHSPTLSASVNSSPPQEVHHVSGQLLAAVAIEWRGSIRATAEHSCSRNAATWAGLLKACSRQLNAQLRQLWIWWHHCTGQTARLARSAPAFYRTGFSILL